jgi:AcrR family transcriptional regulator
MTQAPPRPPALTGAELRERRRLRMAAEIQRVALELFVERGFAAVTVDDIAAVVNISRRTLFRYFASKDDVLFGDPRAQEEALVGTLSRRPPDQPPVAALHETLVELARDLEADPALTSSWLQVMDQEPDVVATAIRQRQWIHRRATTVLAARMNTDEVRDIRPALIVGVSLSAMYAGMWHWLINGAIEPLHEVVSRALADAAAGLVTTAERPPP